MARSGGGRRWGGLALVVALGAGLAPVAVAGPLIQEFSAGLTAGSAPNGITAGPDGNLWFTEVAGNRIGRITPAGVITEFSAGLTAGSLPEGITAGPDGNLWFTAANGNRIGRITPAGVITEFTAGLTANSGPFGITAGPDGNLWFTAGNGNRIGRITPAGVITEFSAGLTANSGLFGITAGPDGNLWFTERDGNRIGRITPAGVITEFSAGLTAGSGPEGITAGPDGNLWFTEGAGNRIGRITPAGVITEFSAGLTAGSHPARITAGPDGNLWFTEQNGDRIGVITPAGVIVELSIPTAGSAPDGITAGPGGVWFVEQIGKIGRVRVTGQPGDFDGDGKADIVTGAGAGGGPHVRVVSGAGGQELRGFFPFDPAFTGGVRVASCDITGDGVPEIVTAAGPGGGPHVQVFDGKTGVPLPGLRGSFFAYAPAFTGGVFVACADVSGDGVPDVITGPGPGGGPHVRVFSGTNGSEVTGFFAYPPGFTGGVFVGLASAAAPGPLIQEFAAGLTAGSSPVGITAGPDGNLWFTEQTGNRIGRITPAGAITEFTAGLTAGSQPLGITAGPDGNLWFTEVAGNRIGRITPAGVITEFSAGLTAGSRPFGITAGPDGNLWFTEADGNRIGRITPAGVITEFSAGLTAFSSPTGITAGPDGNLWFTEFSGDRIGRITPAGVITEFAAGLTAFSSPTGITAGPDGNLWFTEQADNRIGRITPAGVITEFAAGLTVGSGPFGITAGPDGNLWFTEVNGNRIGVITPAGVIVELSIPPAASLVPTPAMPSGITAGPGGVWFTEQSGNRIGRVRVTGEPGDFDGDGRADIVTGAGAGGGPHVRVVSGAGGQGLRSFFAYAPAFTGGVRVASCDITGDGVPEIVTAAGPGGGPHVQVFNGKTGVPLPGLRGSFFAYAAGFTGGVFVACADVNGDAVPDVITGPGPGGGPHVRVFSGTDGSEVTGFFAYAAAFTGGVFVAP